MFKRTITTATEINRTYLSAGTTITSLNWDVGDGLYGFGWSANSSGNGLFVMFFDGQHIYGSNEFYVENGKLKGPEISPNQGFYVYLVKLE